MTFKKYKVGTAIRAAIYARKSNQENKSQVNNSVAA